MILFNSKVSKGFVLNYMFTGLHYASSLIHMVSFFSNQKAQISHCLLTWI